MSTAEIQLAGHAARITALEEDVKTIASKLDRLEWWIIGVLTSSLAGLIVSLFKK